MSEKLFDVALVKYIFVGDHQSDEEVITFVAKSQSYDDALKLQLDYNSNPRFKRHAELYETGILENKN